MIIEKLMQAAAVIVKEWESCVIYPFTQTNDDEFLILRYFSENGCGYEAFFSRSAIETAKVLDTGSLSVLSNDGEMFTLQLLQYMPVK